MYDPEKQKTLNEAHAKNPQPGDYWEEHFCGVCVVLAVEDDCVIFCNKKKDAGENKWTWDLDKTDIKTVDEFNDWLRYSSIPGYWCDVMPEAHKWALSAQ
jgi:hypothetical protein